MNNQSYTTSFTVNQSAEEVFSAITNVRDWWSQGIKGDAEKQGDEFVFEVPEVHYTKQKLVEVVPNKRIVWLVTECTMNFVKDKSEWEGTKMIFDISRADNKTKVSFTHEGLVPEAECYKFCTPSWEQYIKGSLYKLITTGQGTPNLEGKTIEKPAEA